MISSGVEPAQVEPVRRWLAAMGLELTEPQIRLLAAYANPKRAEGSISLEGALVGGAGT